MRNVRVFLLMILLATPTLIVAQQRYRIAVCDWMILKRQKIGEFGLAKQLGCDGIEMDMGGLGRRDSFDNKLREPSQQRIFRHTADS